MKNPSQSKKEKMADKENRAVYMTKAYDAVCPTVKLQEVTISYIRQVAPLFLSNHDGE